MLKQAGRPKSLWRKSKPLCRPAVLKPHRRLRDVRPWNLPAASSKVPGKADRTQTEKRPEQKIGCGGGAVTGHFVPKGRNPKDMPGTSKMARWGGCLVLSPKA